MCMVVGGTKVVVVPDLAVLGAGDELIFGVGMNVQSIDAGLRWMRVVL